MQFYQSKRLSPKRSTAEMKMDDIGTLHDLDLKDDENENQRVYEPRMVTAPLRLYEPQRHLPEQKIQRASEARVNSRTTLYDKVFLSIRQGNQPKVISIPEHRVAKNIVFYNVVTSNDLLRWDSWIRYDDFASLHQRLGVLAVSLDITLPRLPAKFPKLLVNHQSKEFIEHRRSRLQFYLRKLNTDMLMRYSEDFVTFLLPSRQAKVDILEKKLDGAGTWGSSEEEPLSQENKEALGTWGSSSEEEVQLNRPLHGMLPLALLMPNDRGTGSDIRSIPLVPMNR